MLEDFWTQECQIKIFFEIFKFIQRINSRHLVPRSMRFNFKNEEFGFDILKIASVSALDFNLHERACKNKIPKIISTGGLKLEDIDKIVNFYSKNLRGLLLCIVSQLRQITIA